MELDSDWADYNSPSVNERTTEQVYEGSYARKFTAGTFNSGIKSSTFTTASSGIYYCSVQIYSVTYTT
jgi:hypothetical protein